MTTNPPPDQTLAAVRASDLKDDHDQFVRWLVNYLPAISDTQARRIADEAVERFTPHEPPPEPGKLPMVGGRETHLVPCYYPTGYMVYDKPQGDVRHFYRFLTERGEWQSAGHVWPTREAAEQFVRECAAKEQASQSVTRSLPNAVKQTTPTNCFAACVASILGVPIDSVPGVDGANWDWDKFEDWLATQGWQAVEMTFGNGGTIYPVRAPVPCVISGRSPRGDKLHAVCGELIGSDGFRLTHDPHLSDLWIDGDPVHATFFVPLDSRQHWPFNVGGEKLGSSNPSQPATDPPPPEEPFTQELADRVASAIDFCRANMHPGVNVGRQAMAGEVLRILEGR